jgi:HAD superfamily hydrolase (TIGR01484 family)
MRPLGEMPPALVRRIQTLFTDIDDTLTTDGKIPPAAYPGLWLAAGAGLRVIPVTGRPAGWCDHLARMWPVDAVVGENGALAFSLQSGRMRRIYAPREADAAARLERIREEILAAVPGCEIAADQPYREYDLAVDFCEEVEPLDAEAVDRIVAIFAAHGATAKVSSIHVNGYFGAFDKLSMCRRCMEEIFGEPLDADRCTFVGDSPNDEPMFRFFPHAVGVANLQRWTSRMEALPAYVTSAPGGEGFAELVDHLIQGRR